MNTPLFSEADSDLRRRTWRKDRDGYYKASTTDRSSGVPKWKTFSAHRVVLSRVLQRTLTEQDICDHINFDRTDNRRENLRLVDRAGNSQHRLPQNAIGLRGVTKHKCGKWQAAVGHKGMTHYCGLHSTPEAAAAAAKSKRETLGFLTEATR